MSHDEEHAEVPSPSTAFDAYQIALQGAAIGATKSSIGLPRDLSFHRSLDRKFGKRLDACSARILALTARLLDYVEDGYVAGKGKGKHKLQTEEDVVDGFHSHVVDPMDQLLERADTCLDEFLGRKTPAAIAVNPQAQPRPKATKIPHGRLDPALAYASHLPKPQRLFHVPVDNLTTPWRPQLKTKPHALLSLGESLADGAPHPYQYEITHHVPPAHLLAPPPPPVLPDPLTDSDSVTYIAHADQLPALLAALKGAPEIAVDLEHHSYRSFAGFVCLMQISTRSQDWIIDCLDPDVRTELECFNEVFADPRIVKVFHGAESDIVWLQQNFNLYIINLFDTYHATKVLDFPKHSLAALLEMYCDFIPDKRFQLADWRIRPLPAQMLHYARADTHFLLFIYDSLRRALAPAAAAEVFRRSSETALRSYAHMQDTGGWEALGRRWNRNLTGAPGAVFRAVHSWRDSVARAEDESTRYVLANHYVFQIAEHPPVDVAALFAIFQGVPPLVRSRAQELLAVIREAVQSTAQGVDPSMEEDIPVSAEVPLEHVRVVGRGVAGFWDQLRPRVMDGALPNIAASSALFGVASSNATPAVSYAASTSALFGARTPTQTKSDSDARYHALAARIHASLVVAPVLATAAVPVSTTTPAASPPPHSITPATTPPPSADPAVQAEIPFVPRAQRHADPNAGDGVVVVGRSKKRKRHNPASNVKKNTSASASPVPDFDYATAPDILAEAEPTPVAKKRREKGLGVQHGDFKAPPRNLSEMKGGNMARTFR